MPRRSPIDCEFALIVGGLLVLDASVIACFRFGPYHTPSAFLTCVAASFVGLIGILVAAGALLLGVRRRRFGHAPTNLTRNDVLGVVFGAILGIDAVAILALHGVAANRETLITGAFAAGGLGPVLWVVYRLVTTAKPLRARPDIHHERLCFDTNHEFPPYGQ